MNKKYQVNELVTIYKNGDFENFYSDKMSFFSTREDAERYFNKVDNRVETYGSKKIIHWSTMSVFSKEAPYGVRLQTVTEEDVK